MKTVTVFRRVPPPIIGVCGVVSDRGFEALEETLDWLETTGTLVERFDPAGAPGGTPIPAAVADRLEREGDRCLPLVVVDGVVVSAGVRLGRSRLARVVGLGRPDEPRDVASRESGASRGE